MTATESMDLSKSTHNYYIDLYRFFLMVWIVLFHYTVQYNTIAIDKPFYFPFTFNNGGTIGVSLFFMVSGFFMTKALMTTGYGLREYGKYILRRYIRLWVPYVLACVIIFSWLYLLPVDGRTVNFTTFLANLACIIHPGFDRVDNAHWFLEDLFIVQLLLGLILLFGNKKLRQVFLSIAFSIVAIAQILPPPIMSGVSKELFEVLLGVQLCMLINNKNIVSFILTIAGLLVVGYLSVALFVGAVIFLFLLYLGEKYPLPSSANKCQDVLRFVGTISFYWYLVHQNIGYSIMYYVLPEDIYSEFVLLIPISITLLITFPVFLFDKQVNKQLSKRIAFLNK